MRCSIDGTSSHPDCLFMQVYNSTILVELVMIMESESLDFLWIGGCCIYMYFLTIDVFYCIMVSLWYSLHCLSHQNSDLKVLCLLFMPFTVREKKKILSRQRVNAIEP